MCYYIFIGNFSFFNSWTYPYRPSFYVSYTTPVIIVLLDGLQKTVVHCFIARKREVGHSITVLLKLYYMFKSIYIKKKIITQKCMLLIKYISLFFFS